MIPLTFSVYIYIYCMQCNINRITGFLAAVDMCCEFHIYMYRYLI
jgi:hypothetical protein